MDEFILKSRVRWTDLNELRLVNFTGGGGVEPPSSNSKCATVAKDDVR